MGETFNCQGGSPFIICWDLLGFYGFAGSSDGKEPVCNAGDLDSVSGLRRCPEEGIGDPLQCACLENAVDGGAWQATVHGAAKSWIQLSD